MSDIKKEGDKPAYPTDVSPTQEYTDIQGGMTIRQAYKMAALQGLLADSENMNDASQNAEVAGRFADAMIKEDIDHAEKMK